MIIESACLHDNRIFLFTRLKNLSVYTIIESACLHDFRICLQVRNCVEVYQAYIGQKTE